MVETIECEQCSDYFFDNTVQHQEVDNESNS